MVMKVYLMVPAATLPIASSFIKHIFLTCRMVFDNLGNVTVSQFADKVLERFEKTNDSMINFRQAAVCSVCSYAHNLDMVGKLETYNTDMTLVLRSPGIMVMTVAVESFVVAIENFVDDAFRSCLT